jgi:hypothetical protein
MVGDDPLRPSLDELDAHLLVEGAHALGVAAMNAASSRSSSRRVHAAILPDRAHPAVGAGG